MHNNEMNKTINISFYKMNVSDRDKKINILNNKNEEEKNYICKICEYDIINKEEIINNKCEQCDTYFCQECLYLHIKELVKNGKYALFCPECRNIYTKNKIEQIFMLSKDKEVKNLKKLLERNKTKDIIINDPELMFCPIVNCDGFAKKNDLRDYNICNMGHKFCNKCGELWHQNGKCEEEEKVDKLFQEFYKKYKLKNCPYCHIVVIKKGGCNHMKCQYCGKDWCWLCDEIFISTEEHYGNRNSKCFNKMMNNNENNQRIICNKCDNEINDTFRSFDCGHIICSNCFIDNLVKSEAMIIFPQKIINCTIVGCKGIRSISGEWFIEFVNQTNNEELIKKYKNSFLFFRYSLRPIFRFCSIYMEILFKFYELIISLFECCSKYESLKKILEVLGIIFGLIFMPIYIIIIPIYPHLVIKNLYYFIFLPEIKNQFNNRLISLSIILGEEIFSLVFIFTLIIFHYIFLALVFPIFSLVILIRNIIYGISIC